MTDELDRRATGATDFLLAAVAFVFAFALRALTWPGVFTEAGVRLVGPDAHYHLRRIQWSVPNLPEVLERDAYVSFPHGGEPIWTPFFDGGVALIARIAGLVGDETGIETLAVWIPPLLGATTVAAVYLVGSRSFGRRVGLVAAATLCVLPAHVGYSQVGFVDHHAAVALTTTLLLAALLGSRRRHWDVTSAAMLGSAIGVCLLIWPGSLLHVGIAQAVLLGAVIASADGAVAGRRAGHAAIVHGVAFLWVAPFAIGRSWEVWGEVSPLVLSGFQPLWLGLPAVALAACALGWRFGLRGHSVCQRSVALAAVLVAPLLGATLVPGVREGVSDAVAWFFRAESFQAVVVESLPLFSDGREFTTRRANRSLTRLLYALPLMLVALAATRRSRFEHRTLAFWSAGLFAATLAQYRFANSFAVAWAITIGCALDLGWRAARDLDPRWRRLLPLAAGVAAVLLLLPIARSHANDWGRTQRALRGEAVRAPEVISHHESLVAAATWLREHSPETAGWSDAAPHPRYGVLTAWGDGHVLRYVARRPVIQDNFGDDVGSANFEDAERYFTAPDEASALAIAAQLRIRYVLVREAGSGHASRPYPAGSMFVRLHRLRGSAGSLQHGNHPDAARFAPALARHRLVYESPPEPDRDGRFKLYEIVKGAHVVGTASAGESVEARLVLESPDGVRFEYRAHTRASGEGRYHLHLPYPTLPGEAQLVAAGAYAIESNGIVAALRVDDHAVSSGSKLEGPSLVE